MEFLKKEVKREVIYENYFSSIFKINILETFFKHILNKELDRWVNFGKKSDDSKGLNPIFVGNSPFYFFVYERDKNLFFNKTLTFNKHFRKILVLS